MTTKSSLNENVKMQTVSSSPEKEDRYYTTRGSIGLDHDNGKVFTEPRKEENRGGAVWPKLYVTLSSKEKEEDFMAMKGCKLPQRPKKRAKLIQRTLLVSLFTIKGFLVLWIGIFLNSICVCFLKTEKTNTHLDCSSFGLCAVGKSRSMVIRPLPRKV